MRLLKSLLSIAAVTVLLTARLPAPDGPATLRAAPADAPEPEPVRLALALLLLVALALELAARRRPWP